MGVGLGARGAGQSRTATVDELPWITADFRIIRFRPEPQVPSPVP
jgi:hypothetical protein